MTVAMVFLLLGGLGLFLYGMKTMSDALENAAGDRMRRVLEVLTKNRFAGVGVGTGVTMLVQSSSATTVMVVGFVNAGLMTLLQATGVIMGANIGTTITAQLIAFKFKEIAPFILFIGIILTVFIQKRSWSRFGAIILGFGLLFLGLTLMSQAMSPLRENEAFRNFLITFRSPVIGVLFGAVFTAIIQSSSASVGVLQALAGVGLLGLDSAVYVILGQNIGTCITAILSAIGTNANAKRAAGIHLLFNIMGTAIFMIVLAFFPNIVTWIESTSTAVDRQIANFHSLFNVSVTLLLLPFAGLMVKLVKRIIPEKIKPGSVEKRLLYLDERIAQTPVIALSQTLKEVNRMGTISAGNFQHALDGFFDQDEAKLRHVYEVEKTVDYLCDNITNYLIEFRGLELSEHDLKVLGGLHHVIIDFERISDFAENVAEFAETLADKRANLSEEAKAELKTMADMTMKTLRKSLELLEKRDRTRLNEVEEHETEVDRMQNQFIHNHIERLSDKACDPQIGVVFTNMITTLERVADHAVNIAFSITNE